MTFAFPPALVLAALLVPVSIILFIWKLRWVRRQLAGVIAPRLREQLTSSVDLGKRRAKAVVFVAGLIFMMIAIARPQWGFLNVGEDRKNVDLIVAVDLSRSMLAEDMVNQSRLTAARSGVSQLLDELSGGDRIGLIAFAGEAFLAAPVTFDHEAVRRNLAALEPKLVARPGSDIASAIKLAERTFSHGDYETKALLLVTDGEELQGDAVIAARDAAAKSGMRIYTIGVGSATGTRIPERANPNAPVRFAKNEFGTDVITRLNPRVLQQISASGRGSFEPIGGDCSGPVKVYTRDVRPLGHATRQTSSKDHAEYFQWPLGLAIALFLIELLINERRRAPRMTS